MAKTCIIETTSVNLPILRQHLPPDVQMVGEGLSDIDHDHIRVRLEGDGLPPWCVVTHGYMHAVAELLEDGTLRLIPGSGLPDNQVPDCFQEV